MTNAAAAPTLPVVNIAAYKFVRLPELKSLRERLRRVCNRWRLKGTILLSTEGINLFLAAPEADIKAFWEKLTARAWFSGMAYQESKSEHQPFKKMLVKIRREIITFDRPEVDPLKDTAPRITPLELKKWLDEGRDFVLLDTRNAFEVEFGTFETATHLDIR
ncbi:MAG: pseudouridine synthase, partial [Planctomycetales bacterium]|nr:pseudouridine synthase [Planctomycetales bacterium]